MRAESLVGRVLTPWVELPRSLVTLRDGRIEALHPWPGPAPSEALDAEDGWIAPGFIDLQVNGLQGVDFGHPVADLPRAARALFAYGVTAFLPTVITIPWQRYPAVLSNLSRPLDGEGATPLGVHLEGPF